MQIHAHIRIPRVITHILSITIKWFRCKAKAQSKSGVNTLFQKRLFSQYLRGYYRWRDATKRDVVENMLRASLVPSNAHDSGQQKQEKRWPEKILAEA